DLLVNTTIPNIQDDIKNNTDNIDLLVNTTIPNIQDDIKNLEDNGYAYDDSEIRDILSNIENTIGNEEDEFKDNTLHGYINDLYSKNFNNEYDITELQTTIGDSSTPTTIIYRLD